MRPSPCIQPVGAFVSDRKPRLLLSEAAQLFELDNAARRLTPNTRTFYDWGMRRFAAWCEGRELAYLDEVTPHVLRLYLVHLQERRTPTGKPFSSTYVHNLIRVLRRFFSYCVEDELLELTPFRTVRMPRVEKKVLKALTPEEVDAVLRVCKNRRDRALVYFLLDSGVRAAELCGLTVGDVDQNTGSVLVRFGKGQKQRMVYVGVKTRKALRLYLIDRGRPPPSAPLFLSLRREPMTGNALMLFFRRIQGRSGVRHVTAHALRRTYAITCLRNGMDIHSLRLLMGHADLDMLKQYLDFTEHDLSAAHARYGPLDGLTKGK